MESWKKIAPDEEIKVGWRRLVKKTFEQPDGEPAEYVTKDRMGSVSGAVIALTTDSRVVVAEQFRPGPEKIMQELPGGGVNPDENHQNAVMRELLEETGYTSSDVVSLGTVYKDAYTNTISEYYLARNCEQTDRQSLDEGEFVNVRLIAIDELFENARTARMTDTEAVFLAYEQLKAINQREGQ